MVDEVPGAVVEGHRHRPAVERCIPGGLVDGAIERAHLSGGGEFGHLGIKPPGDQVHRTAWAAHPVVDQDGDALRRPNHDVPGGGSHLDSSGDEVVHGAMVVVRRIPPADQGRNVVASAGPHQGGTAAQGQTNPVLCLPGVTRGPACEPPLAPPPLLRAMTRLAAMRGSIGAARVSRLLAVPALARPAEWVSRHRLRILAYHDVPDGPRFADHLDEIVHRWHPVSGAAVVAWLSGAAELPQRAVWVTFDDGRPGVVCRGLPELERRNVPATMFLSPGPLELGEPFWWQAIEARPDVAAEVHNRRLSGRHLVRVLKTVDDSERRAVLADVVRYPPSLPIPDQLDRALLERWLASGREVGNHTWDHPILDRCTAEEQSEQVRRAHDWLCAATGSAPVLFAYPNGDHTDRVAAEIDALGYGVGCLFDHRLASRANPAAALSRLRIDADASVSRLRAILGGGHSALFGMTNAVRAPSVGSRS